MDRTFTGFAALPPSQGNQWWIALGVSKNDPISVIERKYKQLRSLNHPDRGGDADVFNKIQLAWQQAKQEKGG